MPITILERRNNLKRKMSEIEDAHDIVELRAKSRLYSNLLRRKNSSFHRQNESSINHHKECYNTYTKYCRYKIKIRNIDSEHSNNDCKCNETIF